MQQNKATSNGAYRPYKDRQAPFEISFALLQLRQFSSFCLMGLVHPPLYQHWVRYLVGVFRFKSYFLQQKRRPYELYLQKNFLLDTVQILVVQQLFKGSGYYSIHHSIRSFINIFNYFPLIKQLIWLSVQQYTCSSPLCLRRIAVSLPLSATWNSSFPPSAVRTSHTTCHVLFAASKLHMISLSFI